MDALVLVTTSGLCFVSGSEPLVAVFNFFDKYEEGIHSDRKEANWIFGVDQEC